MKENVQTNNAAESSDQVQESDVLDVKKLAIEAKELKEGKPQKKSYYVSMNMYPDFAITRKTDKTEKSLVIMPSCEGYFIRTKKNGKTITEKLSKKLYSDFMSDCDEIEIDNKWIKKLKRGAYFYDALFQYLGYKDIIEMIRKGCAPCFSQSNGTYVLDHISSIYSKIPVLYREFHENEKAMSFFETNTDFILEIQETYSLEKARIFMHNYIDSDLPKCEGKDSDKWVHGSYSERRNTLRPDTVMDFDKMMEYALHESVRMGYKRNMKLFWTELNDCYEMQRKICGRIKNKYPKCLSHYHLCLSSEMQDMKAVIDEKQFTAHAKENSKYEYVGKKYAFTVPKKKEDIYNEAVQQSNCLVSYIEKITEGKTVIFFMRNKNEPDKSLVDIEVKNGVIRQAYQSHNRELTAEQELALSEWYKKMFQ